MTQHDDQTCPKLFGREFNAADLGRSDDVAGDPNDEQIAQALVEDDLDGYTRIGTSENGRERLLARGRFDAAKPARKSIAAAGIRGEAAVTFLQEL
jgi:hypothetical protein